ncbi:acyl-CoA N-acyltransferase [Crucibulum laeve]|uniref:Acyl-CoA N-acyltransferase n=1 Tax=Crucibulum laeve TaxID=68775 RepID=A0A5C3LU73_9AGAR|nr:acyl-CoA N-acyltransferase [Crucibulum laeve]
MLKGLYFSNMVIDKSRQYQNSSMGSDAKVNIRPFRNGDATQIREIFMLAMVYGQTSPMRRALRAQLFEPATFVLYGAFIAGLMLLIRDHTRMYGAALSFISVALFYSWRTLLWRKYLSFMEQSTNADLANIANSYGLKVIAKTDNQEEIFAPSGVSCFWVAEIMMDGRGTGKIAGFVGLDVSKSEDQSVAELRRMAVSPAYHRRGIAARLINTAITQARAHNVTSISLSTTMFQLDAINMYKKFGWVEERRQWFKPTFLGGALVVWMRLTLTK